MEESCCCSWSHELSKLGVARLEFEGWNWLFKMRGNGGYRKGGIGLLGEGRALGKDVSRLKVKHFSQFL